MVFKTVRNAFTSHASSAISHGGQAPLNSRADVDHCSLANARRVASKPDLHFAGLDGPLARLLVPIGEIGGAERQVDALAIDRLFALAPSASIAINRPRESHFLTLKWSCGKDYSCTAQAMPSGFPPASMWPTTLMVFTSTTATYPLPEQAT